MTAMKPRALAFILCLLLADPALSLPDFPGPRADDLPSFNVQTAKGTPCTHNPLGVKGCGEAGAIGSPAAVMNAICDAIGVKDLPMPATPCTVWTALQSKA